MGQHGSGRGARDDGPGGPGDGPDATAGERTGESAGEPAGAGAETGVPEEARDENWDSWRLRVADYGIGILIALILTPVLGFAVLLAVSGQFRDYVLR